MLKTRLEKMIPDNQYMACSLADSPQHFADHDVVLTFDELKPFVVKALGEHKKPVKTIEDFNSFAKELFKDFLVG